MEVTPSRSHVSCCVLTHGQSVLLTYVAWVCGIVAFASYVGTEVRDKYAHPALSTGVNTVDSLTLPGLIVCPLNSLDQSKSWAQYLTATHPRYSCVISRANSPNASDTSSAFEPLTCPFTMGVYTFTYIDTDPRLCLDVAPGVVIYDPRDFVVVDFSIHLPNASDPRTVQLNGVYFGLYSPADGMGTQNNSAIHMTFGGGISVVQLKRVEYRPLSGAVQQATLLDSQSQAKMQFDSPQPQPDSAGVNNTQYGVSYRGSIYLTFSAIQVEVQTEFSTFPWLEALGCVGGFFGLSRAIVDLCLGLSDRELRNKRQGLPHNVTGLLHRLMVFEAPVDSAQTADFTTVSTPDGASSAVVEARRARVDTLDAGGMNLQLREMQAAQSPHTAGTDLTSTAAAHS